MLLPHFLSDNRSCGEAIFSDLSVKIPCSSENPSPWFLHNRRDSVQSDLQSFFAFFYRCCRIFFDCFLFPFSLTISIGDNCLVFFALFFPGDFVFFLAFLYLNAIWFLRLWHRFFSRRCKRIRNRRRTCRSRYACDCRCACGRDIFGKRNTKQGSTVVGIV